MKIFYCCIPSGFLRRVGQKDIVYKPAPPPKGLREITFYKSIFCSHFDEVPQDVTVLRELVPEYHGMHEIVDRAGEIRILWLPVGGEKGRGVGNGARIICSHSTFDFKRYYSFPNILFHFQIPLGTNFPKFSKI